MYYSCTSVCIISCPVDGWRWIFGIATILAVIQAFGMIFMPESPYFYLTKNQIQECRAALYQIYHSDAVVEVEFHKILKQLHVSTMPGSEHDELQHGKQMM